tara:strand:- start:1601 stop:1951 length:351 start_codon:yes stop_codon:yes gene_type:complete
MNQDLNLPRNNHYVNSKKQEAQKKVENAFSDYKKILEDKTHPDNQTEAYKNNVISVLNRLLIAADEMDSENPGEGIFGLIVLSLRSNLKLRDEIVKMNVELRDLKMEIKRLKKMKN